MRHLTLKSTHSNFPTKKNTCTTTTNNNNIIIISFFCQTHDAYVFSNGKSWEERKRDMSAKTNNKIGLGGYGFTCITIDDRHDLYTATFFYTRGKSPVELGGVRGKKIPICFSVAHNYFNHNTIFTLQRSHTKIIIFLHWIHIPSVCTWWYDCKRSQKAGK